MTRYFRDRAHRGAPVDADYINGQTERALESIAVAGGGSITRFSDNAIITAGAGMGAAVSGLRIDIVEELPPIPDYGGRFVFWTSAGAGTGDNQIWMAFAGQTRWTPSQYPTTKSGLV